VSALRLRELLLARGRQWPQPIEWLDVVGSTNDEMRERARRAAPPWSIVVAGRQTAGRGRRSHAWVSPEGNAYASLLVPPPAAAADRPLVPLVAGLALAEALLEFGVEARLKWPNDVYAAGAKLAGVLAEASSSGATLEFIVLGFGVNVAHDPALVDPGLRGLATSVENVTGASPHPLEVVAAVLIRLYDRYAELCAGERQALLHAWRARSEPWWGRPVQVLSGDQLVRGLAEDVDERGALVLKLDDGSRVAVLAGEASELRLLSRPSS
jgi:BirA family biotin operon repressor/biotin-[acetyl-CoA-carboxylase] ligase